MAARVIKLIDACKQICVNNPQCLLAALKRPTRADTGQKQEVVQLEQENAWDKITKPQENLSLRSNSFTCAVRGMEELPLNWAHELSRRLWFVKHRWVGGLIGCGFIIWAGLKENENFCPSSLFSFLFS